MDADYIESVWWSLKQIFDKGLLVQDHRVAPYCPRCGTGLSDHELAQGYETVVDPSVYVRFPVTGGPLADLGAALLVWTTTPWTLVSNTAVAVQPGRHVRRRPARRRRGPGRRRAAAASRCSATDVEVAGDASPGADLERSTYARPFDLVDVPPTRALRASLADYVTTEDGTGPGPPGARLRRRRPRASAARYGLPVVNPVRPDGHFEADVPLVGGMFFKKADDALVADLAGARPAVPARAVRAHLPALLALPHAAHLLRAAVLVHPHHRDQGPAARARTSETNWFPETIKCGRYGDWLQQQHRLGAVAQPLLGHAAADLALRRDEPPDVRRLARRARRARRPGPVRASTRTGRSSTTSPSTCAECGETVAPGARGHRRLVRLRRDAVRPVGLPAHAAGERVRARATRRSSSARRSTRPAAGSTR